MGSTLKLIKQLQYKSTSEGSISMLLLNAQ